MPFGPDPKKPHAVCIHGAAGGGHSLPENFPLDQFVKKATCKKSKDKPKMYDCYFDYDPAKFNERSGVYKAWDGSLLLWVLIAAIVLLIAGFTLFYCFCLKGRGGGGGGHGGGGGGGSYKSLRSGIHGSKSNRSQKSKGGRSSKVGSKKSSGGSKSKSHHGGKSSKSKKSSKKSGKK